MRTLILSAALMSAAPALAGAPGAAPTPADAIPAGEAQMQRGDAATRPRPACRGYDVRARRECLRTRMKAAPMPGQRAPNRRPSIRPSGAG